MRRDDLIGGFALVEIKRRLSDLRAFTAADVVGWIPVDQIFGEPVLQISEAEAEKTLKRLSAEQVLRTYDSDRARSRFTVNHSALDQVFIFRTQNLDDAAHRYAILGIDWLAEELGEERAEDDTTARVPQIQRLDDAWEPLPIDRTAPEYLDAIASSEAALQEIESSNGYAATEPEERTGIIESIRGSLKSIKEGLPSLAQIKTSLLAPLKYVARKFADASLGEAAKQAVIAIGKWLIGLL